MKPILPLILIILLLAACGDSNSSGGNNPAYGVPPSTPDGARLVLKLADLHDAAVLWDSHAGDVIAVTWSSDGSASLDGTARLWQVPQ